MPRNKLWLLLLCLGAFSWAPAPAYAYNFIYPTILQDNTTGLSCPGAGVAECQSVLASTSIDNVSVCPGPGLTRALIPCIKETIVTAVNNFLVPFSLALASTVGAACMLAVVLWGALVATGKASAVWRDAMMLFLKIGAIVMVTVNFGGLFPILLDCMDYMISVVTSYATNSVAIAFCANDPSYGGMFRLLIASDATYNPSYLIWDYLDCSLQLLLGGIFSPLTLILGIIGFIVCCLFSSSAGFFIALMLIILLIMIIVAIARTVFMYIFAYMALAIMALISPLFTPLILFRPTKAYFAKWFRLTAAFVLQPIIIFTYLAMLLAAFDTVVFTGPDSLFRAIAYDNNQTTIDINGQLVPYNVDTPGFEIGAWVFNSGAYVPSNAIDPIGVNIDPQAAMRTLGMGGAPGGAMGLQVAAALKMQASSWLATLTNPFGILGNMGIGINPATGQPDQNFLNFASIEMPTTAINWQWLAAINNTDSTTYLINLFLVGFMALITGYIFWTMLNALPFISAAVAGKPVGPGAFGEGKLLGDFTGSGRESQPKLGWYPQPPPAGFG
ncbi:MAG: type IV secretion system protein [Pseudomonadota bacterium]|nr:type IV secretion system protein [Pseudomonadota bacterium]